MSESEVTADAVAAIETGQLGRARTQLGLSLADLSAQTRIPKRHLAALENHQVDRLPAKLFVIGYLRTCADRLDIDLEKLLAEYGVAETVVRDATANASAAETILAGDTAHSVLATGPGIAARPTVWRVAAVAIVPLLCIIVFAWAYSSKGDAVVQQIDTEVPRLAIDMQPAPLGQLASVAVSSQGQDILTEENSSPEGLAVLEVSEAEEGRASINDREQLPLEVATESASNTSAEAMVAQYQSQDRLVIRVAEDSWVDISDAAGVRLFRDLARAGKKIEVSGDLPFKLHLGNAPGLTLELNGSPFAIKDYRDDNSVRFVLGGG